MVFVVLFLFFFLLSVERYDPSKDSWEMVAPMANKRINFGVGVMLGFIFVVGGHNGVSHLSSIERYDPHQNQWTACRPMNEPRTGEKSPSHPHAEKKLAESRPRVQVIIIAKSGLRNGMGGLEILLTVAFISIRSTVLKCVTVSKS